MAHDLRLERRFDARPEAVFDAFTDPEAHQHWYKDDPGYAVTSTVDLRVGGVWETAFGPQGASPFREVNRFTEVDRPHRLAYSSTFVEPDGTSFDTQVLVLFEAQRDGTLMTLLQTGFASEKDRDDHEGGWPGFLDRLGRLVTAPR